MSKNFNDLDYLNLLKFLERNAAMSQDDIHHFYFPEEDEDEGRFFFCNHFLIF